MKLFYLVSITVFISCNNKTPISPEMHEGLKVVDRSLVNSMNALQIANAHIYNELQNKLNDHAQRERASIWEPIANKAKLLTDNLCNYLDVLKMKVKYRADYKMESPKPGTTDSLEYFDETNTETSSGLFENDREGDRLERELNMFKENLLNLDTSIKKQLRLEMDYLITPYFRFVDTQYNFTKALFHRASVIEALTILSSFKNNARIAENKVITFCNNQVGCLDCDGYTVIYPVAAASSTFLKAGQKLTVTAGVGEFNDHSQPNIYLNGKLVPLNVNGVSERTIKVSKPGKHTFHVKILYTDQMGKKQSLEKDIEYEVAPE